MSKRVQMKNQRPLKDSPVCLTFYQENKTMKKYITPAIGGFGLYALLFLACRMTGSGILSSGPLDWLFNLLILPSTLIYSIIDKMHPSPEFDDYFPLPSVLFYVFIFRAILHFALKHRKEKNA